jgi:hypothetical protein
MELRDAVEADADRLAELTETPRDVMRNLVHDRTVRVAEDGETIVGFVSYDARDQTVHVTQIDGDPDSFVQLLAEPIGFARTEEMAVELLVPSSETAVSDAAETAGFADTGNGPRFEGEATTRYRIEDP